MRCGVCVKCRVVKLQPQLEGREDLLCDAGTPATWAYGVTTVPERGEILALTLTSLTAAGFPSPRIFTDTGMGLKGRWWTGMLELYIREPNASYYAMFQDDIEAVRGLRQY